MARIFADRVRETSTSTGTGNFALLGAAPGGYGTVASVMATGDTGPFVIVNEAAGEWEVNEATFNVDGELERSATPRGSSNAGALVDFSPGIKQVFLSPSADDFAQMAASLATAIQKAGDAASAASAAGTAKTDAENAKDVALAALGDLNAAPTFDTEADLLAYAPADGRRGALRVANGSRPRGVYLRTAGAWPATPESDTLPGVDERTTDLQAAADDLDARLRAVPAKRVTRAGVLHHFIDSRRRRYGAVDMSGARWWIAGQYWLKQAAGRFRWGSKDGSTSYLDLTAEGIETPGALKLGGSKISAAAAGADYLRGRDRRGRTLFRIGPWRSFFSGFAFNRVASGDHTLESPGGRVIARIPSDGGTVEFPGSRIGTWRMPGVLISIRWANRRVTNIVSDASGYLHLRGATARSTGDFTDAEIAQRKQSARDYSAGIRRIVVKWHKPTQQLVLWIIYGQSLGDGRECWPVVTRAQLMSGTYMMGLSVHTRDGTNTSWQAFGGSTALQPLVATVTNGNSGTQALLNDAQIAALAPGATNAGETPLEGFVAQLRYEWLRAQGKLITGDPDSRWVAAACASAGASIAQLSPGASPSLIQSVYDAIASAKALAADNGWTFSVGGIIYNQGERDYQNATSFEDYIGDPAGGGVLGLFQHLRDYVTAQTGQTDVLPIYMIQTGSGLAADDNLVIARAQLEIRRRMEGVSIVANNATFVDKGTHLTANGSCWEGNIAGRGAARNLVDDEGFQGTHLIGGEYRGKTALLRLHTPVAPLQVATPYNGRTASPIVQRSDLGIVTADDVGPLGIDSVRLDDQVAIVSFGRAVVGTPFVTLGPRANGATICLADSDQRRLVGSYVVYPPGTTGQYLDEDIEPLRGKSYPTPNFCLADRQALVAA